MTTTWKFANTLTAAFSTFALLAPLAGAKPDHEQGRFCDRGLRLDRAFVIVLENHSQKGVIGDPNAPFITSLANTYGNVTAYYGVTHPSEPNYVALISGSNWWINDDNPANRFDHDNLADELEANHMSWGAYSEALPADNVTADFWPSSSNPLYASIHNPFVLFDNIRNDAGRLAHVRP